MLLKSNVLKIQITFRVKEQGSDPIPIFKNLKSANGVKKFKNQPSLTESNLQADEKTIEEEYYINDDRKQNKNSKTYL